MGLNTGLLEVKGSQYLCWLIGEAHEVIQAKIDLQMQTVQTDLCEVCIVVVVLCVLLLSFVYLLYYVCIAVFYFRCRTAG